MRMRAMLCRLRQIHSTGLPTSSTARPRVADSAVVSSRASVENVGGMVTQIGRVRCMGIGSHKEGNRAGQHGVHYPNAKPDGSPEKEEADARREFLEKAKAESASTVDKSQEKGSGGAATELQFGVKDGKSTDEAISHASEELFKQSTSHGTLK